MSPPKTPSSTRELICFVLADFAFRQAKAHTQQTIESNIAVDDLLYAPYLTGIVVTYAKNFVSGSGMKPLPESFSKFSDPRLAHTHTRVMEARHKVYAHRDAISAKTLSYDDQGLEVAYEIAVEDLGPPTGLIFYPVIPELNPDILPDIVALCAFQSERVCEELKKLIPQMTRGKSYNRGVRYKIGIDFP